MRMEPIAILKGDQLFALSIHLCDVFVGKNNMHGRINGHNYQINLYVHSACQLFPYVQAVLVPESVIHLIMEFYHLCYTEVS